jgi:hypothetical protein
VNHVAGGGSFHARADDMSDQVAINADFEFRPWRRR